MISGCKLIHFSGWVTPKILMFAPKDKTASSALKTQCSDLLSHKLRSTVLKQALTMQLMEEIPHSSGLFLVTDRGH